MFAAGPQPGDLLGIAQIGDVDLVQLQIAAAGGAERRHGLAVRLAEIGKEAIQVRVGLGIDRPSPAAKVHDRRRRDRHLRHCAVHVAGDEAEVIQHDGPVPADPAGHPQRQGQWQAAMELDLLLPLVQLDAFKPRDEIEMPERAAVFAVRRRAQPEVLLAANRCLDAAVLDGLQRLCGQRASLARSAGLGQFARAQQAPYMVGSERRQAARPDRLARCTWHGHEVILLFPSLSTA